MSIQYKILKLSSYSTPSNSVYEFYKLTSESADWYCEDLATLSDKLTELLNTYPISKLVCVKIEDMKVSAVAENLGVTDITNFAGSVDSANQTINIKFVMSSPFVIYKYDDEKLGEFITYLQGLGFKNITADVVNGVTAQYEDTRPVINYLIPQGFLKIINNQTGNINYVNNPKVLNFN